MSVEDLQPNKIEIKIKNQTYQAIPPSVGVLMVLKKVANILDKAINEDEDLDTERLLSIDKDLDLIVSRCLPDLKNVTLNIDEIANVVEVLTLASIPEESKELMKENVNIEGPDPKVRKT